MIVLWRVGRWRTLSRGSWWQGELRRSGRSLLWPYGNRSTTTHHGATLVCRSIERNRRGPPSTRPRAHCGQEFGSESHVVTDNERLQSEAGREHAQTDELSCTTTSGIGREAGSDGQPPDKNKASDSAAEPAVTISAAELRERKELMFDAAQSEPRASGRKSAAPAASRGVVQTAWELMEALSTETVKSLSAAFGNFDRVVGAGWLLAVSRGRVPEQQSPLMLAAPPCAATGKGKAGDRGLGQVLACHGSRGSG